MMKWIKGQKCVACVEKMITQLIVIIADSFEMVEERLACTENSSRETRVPISFD